MREHLTLIGLGQALINMESTKPTKNSFWQNQVTKDGDDVSGWVDPDDFYRVR